MFKNTLAAFLSLLLVSCATTMPGKDIKTGSDKVSASIAENSKLSNERIQMHQVSIKNNTNQWLEFDGATFESAPSVSVLVGDKISSWVEACTLENQVSQHNMNLLLGAIGVAGAAVAGSSRHQGTATTGAVVALGSLTALGVRDYQNSKHRIEFQNAFPDKHIFRAFTVPPKKVIQRWILVENPENESFALKAKSKNGVEVVFNFVSTKSEYKSSTNPTKPPTPTQNW